MTSVIHFKLRSAIETHVVRFDGVFMVVEELRREIMRKLGLDHDFKSDIKINNAQTGDGAFCATAIFACHIYPYLPAPVACAAYEDDTFRVARNTTVIVRRVPAVRPRPYIPRSRELVVTASRYT